jgi:large subunit ribosomal protein L13
MSPIKNSAGSQTESSAKETNVVNKPKSFKTYSAKPGDVTRQWLLLDASKAPLGRVAGIAANLLTGKSKPMFTKHIDTGDFVIVINAEKAMVTGTKMENKIYYRHSGYPGSIKSATLKEKIEKDPTEVVYKAVRGMLPVNKLRKGRLARLKVYPGNEHAHAAQKPEKINIPASNKGAFKSVNSEENS